MDRNSAVTTLVLLMFNVCLGNTAFSSPSLLPNVQMETVGEIIQKSTECMRQAGPILFKPTNYREIMIHHMSKQILKFAKCPAVLLPYCKIGHQLRIIFEFMNSLKKFPGLVEKVMTGPMKCWTEVICLFRDNTIVTQCGDSKSIPKIIESGESKISPQKERVRKPGVYNSHKVLIKKKISYEKSPRVPITPNQIMQRDETTTLKPMTTKLGSDLSQPTPSPPSQIMVMPPLYPADQSPVAPQTFEADSSIYQMYPNQNPHESDLTWEFPSDMLPAFGLPISSPKVEESSISTFLPNPSSTLQNNSDSNQTFSESNQHYILNRNLPLPDSQQPIPDQHESSRSQLNNAADQSQTKVVDHDIQILSNEDSLSIDVSWEPENTYTFDGQLPSTLLTHQTPIPDENESSKLQPNHTTDQSQTEVVDHNIQISSNQDSPALNSSWQPENTYKFDRELPSTLPTHQQFIPDQHESSGSQPNNASYQAQTEVVNHNIQMLSNRDSPAFNSSWQAQEIPPFSDQISWDIDPPHGPSISKLEMEEQNEPSIPHMTQSSQPNVLDQKLIESDSIESPPSPYAFHS